MHGRFNQWKKLQPQISAYIGNIMSGPKYEARLRELFSSMDTDDNAVLDQGELLLSLSQVSSPSITPKHVFQRACPPILP